MHLKDEERSMLNGEQGKPRREGNLSNYDDLKDWERKMVAQTVWVLAE